MSNSTIRRFLVDSPSPTEAATVFFPCLAIMVYVPTLSVVEDWYSTCRIPDELTRTIFCRTIIPRGSLISTSTSPGSAVPSKTMVLPPEYWLLTGSSERVWDTPIEMDRSTVEIPSLITAVWEPEGADDGTGIVRLHDPD